MSDRPRLLYLITEDWYFWSHRVDLARAAQQAGYEVVVATRVTDHGERIKELGFQLAPLGMVRKSHNPFRELVAIVELVQLYRRVRPTVVHHVALKPILYGTLAAWITRVPGVINAFGGLGYVFVEDRSRLLRWCVKTALKAVLRLKRSTVLIQNHDDQDQLVREGVVPVSRTRIVAGSGIDVEWYTVQPEPSGIPIVLLPARMLWDKGVGEFVEAARNLSSKGLIARFVLVGRCDEQNPAAIPQSQLAGWVQDGAVEWWGHREDMVSVYGASALVVLPSYYGEGLPKVLLEAAACGRAIVATDMPGCRDIVRDRDNGILIPPKNSKALARAIEELLTDGRSREAMGRRGRELAVAKWSVPEIAGQMMNLYREQLKAASTMDQLDGYA